MKFWKSLLVLTTIAPLLWATHPSHASTALPMEISTGEGLFSLTVPDTNTTQSAYGGRLRRYDVHIAKMVEVTHWRCASGNLSPGTTWTYTAGNGSISMGDFRISCQLARDLAIAYGLGNPEPTRVLVSLEEAGSETQTWNVPVLNLTGGKLDRWMRFTRTFKPNR